MLQHPFIISYLSVDLDSRELGIYIVNENVFHSNNSGNTPLGSITNSATPKTIELDKEITSSPDGESPELIRASKRFTLQNSAAKLLPNERVKNCLKIPLKGDVEIWRNGVTKNSKYANLARCGSVWNCPCCASKISEHRKNELSIVIEKSEEQGCSVSMVTATIPHGRYDSFEDLISSLKMATRELTKPKSWKTFLSNYGIIGFVRALEVTHGNANGWHPHFHFLVVFESPLTVRKQRSIKRDFYNHWVRATTKACIPKPSYKHGIDIRTHDSLAEYLSKTGWSISSELTKAHIKKGKSSRTPFQLLHDYTYKNDKRAGALFVEYANVIKGYMHLTWSRGLKKRFLVEDKTDSEVVEDSTETGYELYACVPFKYWRKCWGSRGFLLGIASKGDKRLFVDALSSIVGESRDSVMLQMGLSYEDYLMGRNDL